MKAFAAPAPDPTASSRASRSPPSPSARTAHSETACIARPVHHLRFHGVFDEQKVAARHLSTGLPDRARLRERETRLSQQDGSSKSDDDTSLHWTLLSCCATRHDTARQSLAG